MASIIVKTIFTKKSGQQGKMPLDNLNPKLSNRSNNCNLSPGDRVFNTKKFLNIWKEVS